MIIADLSKVISRTVYLKIIKHEIKESFRHYKPLLKGILSLYTEEEIEQAIDSIYLVGKQVFAPTTRRNGQILRALEYGTSNNKSYKILSISVRKIMKEVDNNELVF